MMAGMVQKQPRQKNEKHLDFIRGLPCVRCFDDTGTEAAHIRFADDRAGKRHVGKGEKPDDKWTLPLCGRCHRHQHDVGEGEFYGFLGRDPIFLALALWAATGNHELGEQIVRAAR